MNDYLGHGGLFDPFPPLQPLPQIQVQTRQYEAPPVPTITQFKEEDTIPGVTLENYTKREPSEDGTYVRIITHRERVEKIPQPPTPEELEQRKQRAREAAERKKQEDKFMLKALAIGGAVVVGVFGLLAFADRKNPVVTTYIPVDTTVENVADSES